MYSIKDLEIIFAIIEDPMANLKDLKKIVENYRKLRSLKEEYDEFVDFVIKNHQQKLRNLIVDDLISEYYDDQQIIGQIQQKMDNISTISTSTLSRRYNKWQENGLFNNVRAMFSYEKLGLELLGVFILPVSWSKIEKIEHYLRQHAYTAFQNRIYGAIDGIFAQFSIPRGSQDKLSEFFQKLEEKNLLEEYRLTSSLRSIASNQISLHTWDEEIGKFEFDIDKLEQLLQQQHSSPKREKTSSHLDEIDLVDLIVLREQVRDALRGQKEISQFIKKEVNETNIEYRPNDPTPSVPTISRRLNHLKEKGIIKEYNLLYNRETFGLFNQTLFRGTNSPKISGLAKAIENDIIPYPSTLYISENEFLFWVNLPAVENINLINLLKHHFENLEMSLFARNPKSYLPYHVNYDAKEGKWEDSRYWMVEMPFNT